MIGVPDAPHGVVHPASTDQSGLAQGVVMSFIHRAGAVLAAASLIITGAGGPAAADFRELTDDERAAAREKASRARSAVNDDTGYPVIYSAPERRAPGFRDGDEYTGF